jgi:two-component system, NtrC family, response regulator AtoC
MSADRVGQDEPRLSERSGSGARVGETGLELVIFFQDSISSVALPKAAEVTLGRAEDNGVRLDYPAVSRHHAVLRLEPRLEIEDLGGANGTFVRDDRKAGGGEQTIGLKQLVRQRAALGIGEDFALGAVTLVVRHRAPRPTQLDPSNGSRAFPATQSPALRAVYEQAEKAAQSSIAVLIQGETGVGKEILARAIHDRSRRAKKPFMAINCAALGESLLEGELFGYEKGAFTGAIQARPGLFEAAEGGSVLLDELGELPLATQAKLLRVLAEHSVTRLGARSLRKVDVRFLAATNRDVEVEVGAGRFRQDLYYRLNAIRLIIPPLRERTEEIELLARTFVTQACQQLERRTPPSIPDDVMALLRRYSWPGNVRELRNVIERAVVLSTGPALSIADLPGNLVMAEVQPALRRDRHDSPRPAPAETILAAHGVSAPPSMREEVRSLERARIVSALEQCGGNQSKTANLLGISRRTLTSRLAEFELPRPRKPRIADG